MIEESLREIIGLAKKSKWNRIKRYIKHIIEKTLEKETGYNLTALHVLINGKKKSKFNTVIKNKEDFNKIDKIKDFDHLSFYQTTCNSNNLVDISQSNGIIIVLAKYLGPVLKNYQIFDFSVHLDAFSQPFFTIGNGEKINSSEIIDIINNKHVKKTKVGIEKSKKKLISKKETEEIDLEAYVFRKLTNKNPIWNGSETKGFQIWKAKMINNYRIETGKISHYKAKPTKQFSLYLKNMINEKVNKTKTPKKRIDKDISHSKKIDNQISEEIVFETLTGKKAVWNGSITRNFTNWKNRIHKNYRKETGKIPLYKCKLTQNFKKYLNDLIKAN